MKEYESRKISSSQAASNCRKKLLYYCELLGRENFYVELQYHGIEAERVSMPILAELAQETGVEAVASNDAHLINASDAELRAYMFACKYPWKGVADSDKELYLKTDEELSEALGEILPKAVVRKAIDNISLILAQCKVEMDKTPHYPKFACPEGAKARLRALAEKGKSKVVRWTEEYQTRFEYELSVIEDLGFSDYLCVVEDFLR